MILILGAMDEEIKEYLSCVEELQTKEFFNRVFYTGKMFGKEVIISTSGIGKTMAAITTQYFIDNFHIEYVLFTGIAGGIGASVNIEDVIIGTRLVFYDLDTSAFGDLIGEIPRTGLRFIESDKDLVALAKKSGVECKEGLIGTADRFVSSKAEKQQILSIFPDMSAVEMEGCAVALTCKIQDISFLVIRVISDTADGNGVSDFQAFLHKASQTNLKIITSVLQNSP